MSELADRVITALRANHDDLAARVAGFGSVDLARPSGCSEWDVARVLSHLGSGVEISLGTLRAGLAGEPAPDGEFNEEVWDRWNGLDPSAQAQGFLTANAGLVEALEGLDADTRDTASFMWFLPFPVGIDLFAGLRLNETAQHAWDVRVAVDPGATLSDLQADALVDVMLGPASFMAGFLGTSDSLDGARADLGVQTTAPERAFGLSLGEGIAVGETPPAPDGALTAPAEAVIRLIGGRLTPEHTPDSVAVTGPVSLDQLRRVFPGF